MNKEQSEKFVQPGIEPVHITLNVKNLDVMRDFYQGIIGLEILEENQDFVELGFRETKLIKLVKSNANYPHPGAAGLYHTALLFDDAEMLAKRLLFFLNQKPELFEGSGDHLVSQAFYFHDPEGNGLELYVDRPRETWQWSNGQIVMGTEYIDPAQFISDNIHTKDITTHAKIGHVHLKVGNIAEAKKFYAEILGFEIMFEIQSALFVSTGKYHHHLGLNTWESRDAKKNEEEFLGLGNFTLAVSDETIYKKIQENLTIHTIDFTISGNSLITADPWNNKIVILKSK